MSIFVNGGYRFDESADGTGGWTGLLRALNTAPRLQHAKIFGVDVCLIAVGVIEVSLRGGGSPGLVTGGTFVKVEASYLEPV